MRGILGMATAAALFIMAIVPSVADESIVRLGARINAAPQGHQDVWAAGG